MEINADDNPSVDQKLIPETTLLLEPDPPSDRDSPEYKAYYYRRLTEVCYEQMKQMQEFYPENPIVPLWNQLDEDGRKKLVQFGTQTFKFQRNRDIDGTCGTYVLLNIVDALKLKPAASQRKKKAPKGITLLRTAVLNQHAATVKGVPRETLRTQGS